MTSPEPQWVFTPPPRKRAGRVILLVFLAVIVVAVAVTAVVLTLPNSDPAPSPSPSVSESASATPEPSASPTPTPSVTPSPSESPTPEPTSSVAPPAPEVPGLDEFAAVVEPPLQDATTGLGFIADSSAADAAKYADDLIGDAQRLADRPAPDAISTQWRDGVQAYLAALNDLKAAANAGQSTNAALTEARAQVDQLRDLVAP